MVSHVDSLLRIARLPRSLRVNFHFLTNPGEFYCVFARLPLFDPFSPLSPAATPEPLAV
jgi:hypothetical protein